MISVSVLMRLAFVGVAIPWAAAHPTPASAALVINSQFSAGLGTLVGLSYDPTQKRVWAHAAFDTDIQSFTTGGKAKASVLPPGESANDFDLETAPKAFTLGSTLVPAGSLLVINGETGVAEIYALDPTTGATLATLTTGFGASHVVGGAYHGKRNSFFLLQDKVPGGTTGNRVAEISPTTGAVLNTFQISALFSVNFGDLDVDRATGNLFIVSSDEPRIAELTPTGALVQYHALPSGVGNLSGIGIDDKRGEIWVGGTAGTVWRLGQTVTGQATATAPD